MKNKITDQTQRDCALDPDLSCLVQAPAGSGKTGLLTQRYLTLLARVNAPEEIIALTFTRKAASQMRSLIMNALQDAKENKEITLEYEQQTRTLANAVLQRDNENDWQILSSPRRLRVQTIDSFVAALNRQMPILSGFGSMPKIVDDTENLYRQAARATITELETGQKWSAAIEHLMQHLDNRFAHLEELIISMLQRRDHWLRHIANPKDPRIERGELEASLQNAISQGLTLLNSLFPHESANECLQLVRYAAENVKNSKLDAAAIKVQDMDTLPGTEVEDLPVWNSILDLLLTAEKNVHKIVWRKTVNIRNGFPKAEKNEPQDVQELRKSMKTRHGELVKKLASAPGLLDAMRFSKILPKPVYDEDQWQILTSLFELLRLSVAQLGLVFQETGQVDHTAMTRGALQALGEPDSPTDLALSLDYRIHHLLIDEFQDTSLSQYELIERLTAGWQPGDGRSLFLVGDPMQSIYRFREAEVGLYLRAMREGFNDIRLKVLTLSTNFRSQKKIVDWINMAFPEVMPQKQDIANGAVSYSAAAAVNDAIEGEAVTIHPFIGKDSDAEADKVVSLIQDASQKNTEDSIAVLVRSRSHLFSIADQLKGAGIRFQAIEIEQLSQRPVIQDLLALTFAMTHRADRISWLSILRAPWCGMILDDLSALAGDDHERTLWSCIEEKDHTIGMSADGQKRLIKARDILRQRLPLYRRIGLRYFVEGAWLLLGGPACLDNETDLEDARVFFGLLEQHDRCGALIDRKSLADDANRLFALADINAGEGLQLMTIHKAKGLEFDTVIVPGLGKVTKSQDSRLLMWMERPNIEAGNDLLLAPICEYGAEHDSIYNYLKYIEQQKERFESTRLLYVAATRARKRLHLLGHAMPDVKVEDEVCTPDQRSLLYPLWPVVAHYFEQEKIVNPDKEKIKQEPDQSKWLRCLPVGWVLPQVPDNEINDDSEEMVDDNDEPIEFSWAGETVRHIGSAVHRILQFCNNVAELQKMVTKDQVCRILLHLGVSETELDQAQSRVLKMIHAIGNDQKGQWILSDKHSETHNEYALSGLCDGHVFRAILDRTFVDNEGIRWIIDYKTGTHSGGKVDEFLDREQLRYQEQLERYASLMRQIDDRPIRMGLYFPAVPGWREWGLND